MLSRRLLLAYVISLLLHAAMLGSSVFRDWLDRPPPQTLQVTLRLPAPAPPAEPLLKNTLDPEAEKPREEPPAPPPEPKVVKTPPRPAPAEKKPEKKQVQAAQRKLAAHTFYPPEAITRGLEGDVRVILVLTEDGSVADVQVAASSGHAILDNAAVKAAWAMGRLPGITVRQLILPVSFRLQ